MDGKIRPQPRDQSSLLQLAHACPISDIFRASEYDDESDSSSCLDVGLCIATTKSRAGLCCLHLCGWEESGRLMRSQGWIIGLVLAWCLCAFGFS